MTNKNSKLLVGITISEYVSMEGGVLIKGFSHLEKKNYMGRTVISE